MHDLALRVLFYLALLGANICKLAAQHVGTKDLDSDICFLFLLYLCIYLYIMEPTRLLKDELEYELRVRGVPNLHRWTILAMRKELLKRLSAEDGGDLTNIPAIPLDLVTEVDTCTEKIVLLQGLIEEFSGASSSVGFLKISTKLQHLVSRLARISSDNADITASVGQLQSRLREAEAKIMEKVDVADDKLKEPTAERLPVIARKQIPVAKWDVSFSGESDLSVNAFLERIDDFRKSRHVSDSELCDSIIELLKGRALTWYRSVRNQIREWKDFVLLIRKQYEPFDYEVELWEEIRGRTQGADELVGTYVSCMINLFCRLPTPPTESQKLQILRRNILPYLINGIGLENINSVDKLLEVCRTLEMNKLMAEKFQPPPPSHKKNLLEPDLAYRGRCRAVPVHATDVPAASNSGFICWNCHKPGHPARLCQQPKNLRCFGCGHPGVIKRNCPRCSGNEPQRR